MPVCWAEWAESAQWSFCREDLALGLGHFITHCSCKCEPSSPACSTEQHSHPLPNRRGSAWTFGSVLLVCITTENQSFGPPTSFLISGAAQNHSQFLNRWHHFKLWPRYPCVSCLLYGLSDTSACCCPCAFALLLVASINASPSEQCGLAVASMSVECVKPWHVLIV